MSDVLELTKELISRPSLTPDDSGCQDIISQRLKQYRFQVENMRFGEVDNLWARHGAEGPLVVFAGHTDVVPTGPLDAWNADPFVPTIRDGMLYGRGATDMKSGLAAMIVAAERFISRNAEFNGSIGFLITSDEEGPSVNGTLKVIQELTKRNEKIDYCIIGEAGADKELGDLIRVGRRGSLHGTLSIHGKQGHIAYPDKAVNPIHACFKALETLANEKWDEGNDYFPPTSFQISNIHSGTGATNVIPGELEARFNFRYSTAITVKEIQDRTMQILSAHKLNFTLKWELSGNPFLTQQGKLITATKKAIKEICDLDTKLSTGGGTSDGRFIAPTGAEVVELGPVNTSAHQINEYTDIEDLEILAKIYERILEKLLLE